MRYFPVLDLQYTLLLVFLGLVALLLIYLAFRWPSDEAKAESEKKGYPRGLKSKVQPIPPLLIFLFVAVLLWALGYVVVVGISGGPF